MFPRRKKTNVYCSLSHSSRHVFSPHVCFCQPKDNHPRARLSIKSATTFHTVLFIHSSSNPELFLCRPVWQINPEAQEHVCALPAPSQQTPCTHIVISYFMNTEEGFNCNAGALDKGKQPHATLSPSAEEKQTQVLWNCPTSLPAHQQLRLTQVFKVHNVLFCRSFLNNGNPQWWKLQPSRSGPYSLWDAMTPF